MIVAVYLRSLPICRTDPQAFEPQVQVFDQSIYDLYDDVERSVKDQQSGLRGSIADATTDYAENQVAKYGQSRWKSFLYTYCVQVLKISVSELGGML